MADASEIEHLTHTATTCVRQGSPRIRRRQPTHGPRQHPSTLLPTATGGPNGSASDDVSAVVLGGDMPDVPAGDFEGGGAE